jgi:hypothetical protein
MSVLLLTFKISGIGCLDQDTAYQNDNRRHIPKYFGFKNMCVAQISDILAIYGWTRLN